MLQDIGGHSGRQCEQSLRGQASTNDIVWQLFARAEEALFKYCNQSKLAEILPLRHPGCSQDGSNNAGKLSRI